MFLFGGRLLESVLQDGGEIANAFAASGSGAGKNKAADEIRPVVRYHLRNEAAQGEADQIDPCQPERANERNRVLGHRLQHCRAFCLVIGRHRDCRI